MNEKRTKTVKRKVGSGSQKVKFKDYLFIPEQWKLVAYILYLVGIPYTMGAFFLFLFVAGGSWDNFQILNLNAFVIVWLIGSGIVAIFLLIWIIFLYLLYDKKDEF